MHRWCGDVVVSVNVFVQVERRGARRELRLPAMKTVSYINLFTVSVHGSVGGLELIEWTSCVSN